MKACEVVRRKANRTRKAILRVIERKYVFVRFVLE